MSPSFEQAVTAQIRDTRTGREYGQTLKQDGKTG
jgi:hypothetical protein